MRKFVLLNCDHFSSVNNMPKQDLKCFYLPHLPVAGELRNFTDYKNVLAF